MSGCLVTQRVCEARRRNAKSIDSHREARARSAPAASAGAPRCPRPTATAGVVLDTYTSRMNLNRTVAGPRAGRRRMSSHRSLSRHRAAVKLPACFGDGRRSRIESLVATPRCQSRSRSPVFGNISAVAAPRQPALLVERIGKTGSRSLLVANARLSFGREHGLHDLGASQASPPCRRGLVPLPLFPRDRWTARLESKVSARHPRGTR